MLSRVALFRVALPPSFTRLTPFLIIRWVTVALPGLSLWLEALKASNWSTVLVFGRWIDPWLKALMNCSGVRVANWPLTEGTSQLFWCSGGELTPDWRHWSTVLVFGRWIDPWLKALVSCSGVREVNWPLTEGTGQMFWCAGGELTPDWRHWSTVLVFGRWIYLWLMALVNCSGVRGVNSPLTEGIGQLSVRKKIEPHGSKIEPHLSFL